MNLRRRHFSGALISMMGIGCLSDQLYQDRRGSIYFDASIYLLYVPSLMSTTGLQNLGHAVEAFLENNSELFASQIDDIRVVVSSQSVDGRKVFGNNLTDFVVQANFQVLVQAEGNPNPKLIEDKIRAQFAEEWYELGAMLKLLDPTFFANVKYIELKTETTEHYFSTIDSTYESESQGRIPENLMVIFLTIGVGIVLGGLTLLILCCISHMRSKRGSARETVISSFASEESGNIENPSGENANIKRQRRKLATPALKPLPTFSSEPIRKTKNEILVSDEEVIMGQIQQVFSKDTLKCLMVPAYLSSSTRQSLSLNDLRAQKKLAEGCFHKSLKGIIRHNSSEVDVESSHPQREKYVTNVHRVLTPLTVVDSSDHDCPRDQQKEHHAMIRSTQRNSRLEKMESKRLGSSQGRKLFVSKDEKIVRILSHTNHHDGCNVSTVTRSSSIFNAEPIKSEMALDNNTHSKKSATSQPPNDEDDTSITDSTVSCCIGSDADDFGSIAHSLPSCGQTELMEYLEEVV